MIGVLAPLSGGQENEHEKTPLASRRFIKLDRYNFESVIRGLRPRLRLQVANTLSCGGELYVDLRIESLLDFTPDGIARQIGPLQKLLIARNACLNLLPLLDPVLEAVLRRLLHDDVTVERIRASVVGWAGRYDDDGDSNGWVQRALEAKGCLTGRRITLEMTQMSAVRLQFSFPTWSNSQV